jgi:hypothetical protein
MPAGAIMETALMQVVDVVPLHDPGGGHAARTVARFAVQLPEMKLTGFRLRLRPDGSYFAQSPARDGVRVVTTSPAMFRDINQAAAAAFERLFANDSVCA